jgi:hypothetical protein
LETRQIKSGQEVIHQLKRMFAKIQSGIQSYVDPTEVLTAIVDEIGEKFQFGQEQDIGQFNELFISRISDAFRAAKQNASHHQDNYA